MSFRRCNSAAVLAGVLACALAASTRAGDKIEFSTPAIPLQVPQFPRDVKSSPKAAAPEMERPDDALQQAQMADSAEVVVYAPVAKKSFGNWDSRYSDKKDDNTDENSPFDNETSKSRAALRETNTWEDLGRGWDVDKKSIFARDNNDQAVLQNGSLRERLEVEAERKNNSWRDNRYSDRFGSAEDSTGTKKVSDQDTSVNWAPRLGQYQTFLDEMKEKSEQAKLANTWTQASPWPDDTRRETGFSPGKTPGWTPAEWDSKRTEVQSQTTPVITQQSPVQPLTIFPDPYARLGPPPSPPGQVQSQPGILPFPKRPGSVFQ